MSKLTKLVHKIFGANADFGYQMGKYGSFKNGAPEYAADASEVPAFANFEQGLYGALIGNNAPCTQDINGVLHYNARQIGYLYQQGIPEWDAATEYFIGSMATVGSTLYQSLTDSNVNHAVSDSSYWVNLTEANSPVGEIREYIGQTLPPKHLWCNGQDVLKTDYAALYAKIGETTCKLQGTPTKFRLPYTSPDFAFFQSITTSEAYCYSAMGMAENELADVYTMISGSGLYSYSSTSSASGMFMLRCATSVTDYIGLAASPVSANTSRLYAVRAASSDIMTTTGPTIAFSPLGDTARLWNGISADSLGNVYAITQNEIYKRTNNAGAFVAMSLPPPTSTWNKVVACPNGDVYFGLFGGETYKLSAGGTTLSVVPVTAGTTDNWPQFADRLGNVYFQSIYTTNFAVLTKDGLGFSYAYFGNGISLPFNICSSRNNDMYMFASNGSTTLNILKASGVTQIPKIIRALD